MKAKTTKTKKSGAPRTPKPAVRKPKAKAATKGARPSGAVKAKAPATATPAKARAAARPVKAAKPAPKPAAAPAASAARKDTPAAVKDKTGKRPATRPAPSRAVLVAHRRKEFARFRDLLLQKQHEQVQAYSASKEDSEVSLDNGTEDYIDYAVNSYARDFLLSLTELDRKQLLQIEDALRRIDRGEYGRCQQCGEGINPKRLEVQPWARHCVRCQELEEQGLLPQYPQSAAEDEYDAEDAVADEETDEAADEEEFGDEVEAPEEVETPGVLDDEALPPGAEDAEE